MRIVIYLLAVITLLSYSCKQTPAGNHPSPTGNTSSQPLSDKETEKIIMGLEDQWAEALRTDNKALFDKILANNFTFIDPDGQVRDRASYLKDRSVNDRQTDSFEIADLKVTPYGNAALVSGLSTAKEIRNGKIYRFRLRWKELWIQENGQWKVVSGQGTPVNPNWIAVYESKK